VSGRPYVLAETTWKDVRGTEFRVAVLPWGSTEAHNYHLPYSTDSVEAERLAIEAARQAWERGTRVVVLPPIPYGVNTTQLDIALTINMNPSTQLAVLADVVESLEQQGINRLVIFNGHGGNEFRGIIRELQPRTGVFLCTLNWWEVEDPATYFEEPGDHGGEMETSVMLHLTPDLVRSLGEAGPGSEKRVRIAAFRAGWAWAPRRWTQVSEDTGIGNPARATAGKGEKYAASVTGRVADFFTELAAADPDALYE
jgi:creatinine amidohydrolase